MKTTADTTWQVMLRDLRAAGYTYTGIAIYIQLAGASYTHDAVKKLAHGVAHEPGYSPGRAIVDMYEKHCRTTQPSE